MPHTHVQVTTTPTQLTGLTDGTTYNLQNVGDREIFLANVTGTTAPAASSKARSVIPPTTREFFGTAEIKPASGESFWVWVANETGDISLNEAP